MIKLKEQYEGNNAAPDWDELARLSRLCIGSSSIREFSERTGLSRAFLSAIRNNKLRGVPTRRSLCRMTSQEAKPENGITSRQLLRAAGYSDDTDAEDISAEQTKKRREFSGDFLDAVEEYCAADISVNAAAQCFIRYFMEKKESYSFHVISEKGAVVIKDESVESAVGVHIHICVFALAGEASLAGVAAMAAVLKLQKIREQFKEGGAEDDIKFYLMTDDDDTAACLKKHYSSNSDVEILYTKDHQFAVRYAVSIRND